MPGDDRGDELVLSVAVEADETAAVADGTTDTTDAKTDTGEVDTTGKTDDTEGDDDGAGKGKFTKKAADDKMIPKARVDEMVRKEQARADAAEARLKEIDKNKETVNRTANVEKLETEITDLEKLHSKAIIDGDADKAATIARDIRLKERQIQINSSETMTTQARETATEEIRMDMTIEKLEIEYPQLDSRSEEFDSDAVDMILSMQQSLITQNRMTPSTALEAATIKVMSKLGIKKASEAADDTGTKKADDAKALGAAKTKGDRTQNQLDKNIDTVNKQPPSMKDTGLDGDKKGISANVDASKLTMEEFDALPEATKERMRGDSL